MQRTFGELQGVFIFCDEYRDRSMIRSHRKIPKMNVLKVSKYPIILLLLQIYTESGLAHFQVKPSDYHHHHSRLSSPGIHKVALTPQSTPKESSPDNVVAEMHVICHSDSMIFKMNTNAPFNGMIYAGDTPDGNCVTEFRSVRNMTFRLPLKSCGTLANDVDDGVEFFNTVVIQPHMRLMTNQGRGYHIRCKYQTRERTIANTQFNVSASFPMQNNQLAPSTSIKGTASMPSCTMKIFRSGLDNVAEAVKIGDNLIMVIEIDQQDVYGMKITKCSVRDGLSIAEQMLINDEGCPIDEMIMPKFNYTNNYTKASVSFPAHKFPHTGSVYYQCNVRLCINNGGCDQAECNPSGYSGDRVGNNNNVPRKKRFVNHDLAPSPSEPRHSYTPPLGAGNSVVKRTIAKDKSNDKAENMSFDVYSGLYVSDSGLGESSSSDSLSEQVLPSRRNEFKEPNEDICMSPGRASMMIILASLASVGVVLMLVCQVGLPVKNSHERQSMKYPFNEPVRDVHANGNYRESHNHLHHVANDNNNYRYQASRA